MSTRKLMIAVPLCLATLAAPGGDGSSPDAPEDGAGRAAWQGVHDRLSNGCTAMARDLEAAHAALLDRARGDAEATARLTPEPVALRPPGYGVLPEIVDNPPPSGVEPTEKLYSLESLAHDFPTAFRNATILARRAADPGDPLLPLVDELERLQNRMQNLEDHLGYHAYWQTAVPDFPEFFEERNRLVVRVRELDAAASGSDAPWRQVLAELAPFRKTPGLRMEQRSDGSRVLPVTVVTDIGDEAFLAAFREGVESVFVDSVAARESRFAVELRLRLLAPSELYPDGPPAPGDAIDPEAHLERFPKGALVLTTGEESTHAWTGRSIVLGPANISRRTLAHEFAHLLGFRDAYLRGFDATSDDRFGVVLVEWTGLQDDLMGNAKGGRLTPEMVRTLIHAYGRR